MTNDGLAPFSAGMISVVIPTLNVAETLLPGLAALIPAAVEGLVREVVVADGGSTDATLAMADDAGARIVDAPTDRKGAYAAGCKAAKGPWLLILSPDTRLGAEWEAAARAHISDYPKFAGYFRLALDDHGAGARLKEAMAGLIGRPGEAQGLLISKALYESVGRAPPKGRMRPLPARIFRTA